MGLLLSQEQEDMVLYLSQEQEEDIGLYPWIRMRIWEFIYRGNRRIWDFFIWDQKENIEF